MKKLLMAVFALVAVLGLAACGKTEATEPTDTNTTPVVAEVEYKLGLGIEVSFEEAVKNGAPQVDATVAAVVTDKDGKIVLCRIDAVQNKATVTDGVYTITNLKTKMEQGDDYGMTSAVTWGDVNDDGKVLEWYDQAKAFEAHVIGMTGAEVAAMTTETNKIGYQSSTDADLLAAGCTIQIGDFQAAVAKACADEQGITFKSTGEFTLGVAANSFEDKDSKAATETENGLLCMYSDFAASVVENGKIVASLNDAIQPKITFAYDGTLVENAFTDTKRNLKEAYNMTSAVKWGDVNGDGKVEEWYIQSLAFSKHVVGMTGAEVAAMTTETNKIGYQSSTDADLLAAGCTIQITDIKAVVAESVTNAR